MCLSELKQLFILQCLDAYRTILEFLLVVMHVCNCVQFRLPIIVYEVRMIKMLWNKFTEITMNVLFRTPSPANCLFKTRYVLLHLALCLLQTKRADVSNASLLHLKAKPHQLSFPSFPLLLNCEILKRWILIKYFNLYFKVWLGFYPAGFKRPKVVPCGTDTILTG